MGIGKAILAKVIEPIVPCTKCACSRFSPTRAGGSKCVCRHKKHEHSRR